MALKAYKIIIMIFLLSIAVREGWSSDRLLHIKTGAESGTYFQFGLDLKQLGSRHGFTVNVESSEGSMENLLAIVNNERVHLAIIQSDMIEWLADRMLKMGVNLGSLRDLKVKTRWLLPLYDEEVHLIARAEIHSLEDLQDKNVGVGSLHSGSFLTAGHIFNHLGIQVNLLQMNYQEALGQLENKKIDAMLMVGGSPVPLIEKGVGAMLSRHGDEAFHIVPIHHKKLLSHYQATTLPAHTYSWLQTDVSTVAVKSVLVTFDFAQDTLNCQKIGEFTRLINEQIGWLRQNGHAKWKTVDLDFIFPPLFQRSPCLNRK